MHKKTKFRQGQQMEIGFDLNRNHTGKITKKGTRKFTTAEGEMLSNYMENGDTLKLDIANSNE